jgi:hypothetical protein
MPVRDKEGNIITAKDMVFYIKPDVELMEEQAESLAPYMGMQEDAPLTTFMLDRSDNES